MNSPEYVLIRRMSATATFTAMTMALTLAGMLAACSPAGDTSDLAIRPSSGITEGDSGLLTGILRHELGCTFIDSKANGYVVPVFTERTASWSGDMLTFSGTLRTLGKVSAGDTVELGGGEAQGIAEDWTIPEGCRTYGTFWIVAGS
ncbi:hypothetical protein [Arthrobacter sp. HY1533]|uniref:hypothetical protein n=1 Tax=Arthrobacter sp. HY1533 TaxID=2970919 RepID=UPI0022B9ECFF|nr:hypothetical protein [Arthrobacter sp. HY1533]